MGALKDNAVYYPHVRTDLFLYAPHTRSVSKGWTCCRHIHHMMFEFLLVQSGELNAFAGSSERVLREGDLLIVSPMQLHGYDTRDSEEASFSVAHVQISDEELLHLFQTVNEGFYPAGHRLNEALKPLIRQLFKTLDGGRIRSISVMTKVFPLVETIQEHFAAAAAALPAEELTEPAYLIAREIEGMLHRRLETEQDVSLIGSDAAAEAEGSNWLEEISARLNISRRHCHRLFSQAYGMSPRQYLMILKQQEAMQMLERSSDSIELIAYRLGYVNAQSFIRQFSAWVGCTPGTFRRQKPESVNFLAPPS
ncbi:helix-turn-helix domain-containing protein [Paenibacillus sp. HN-1]|uniref:AraC family transcriptional regulator n=1 Tax=Paenibacillus TaxID=44249 RepID=UPI001CA82D55|nr:MULTISPECIES: AraC family transcriptional regulator [Paenibacillus]MBY9079458.1 helix-turn-helix domain-containing protein [Paenibacillus sp. CGMCC 1.18879]MBY9083439.1 helix-turn-helix domain-containing protein [Paenibacillus sinensis]